MSNVGPFGPRSIIETFITDLLLTFYMLRSRFRRQAALIAHETFTIGSRVG